MAGLCVGNGGGQAGFDAVVGQRLHDHAGGERQNLLGCHVELARQGDAGGPRAHQAIGARAGVGIARIDHHGTDGLAPTQVGQMLAADLHGRRTETVLGKDTRHTRTFIEQEHSEVFAMGFADTGFGNTDTDTSNRMEIGGNRGK